MKLTHTLIWIWRHKQEKHFPTVTREINKFRYKEEGRDVLPHIIQKVCEAIEDTYGRLTPSVFDNEVYEKSRMTCLQEIINDKHHSEKMGSTFVNVFNKDEIDEWIAKSKCICLCMSGYYFGCFLFLKTIA